jgi:hypothetical protein
MKIVHSMLVPLAMLGSIAVSSPVLAQPEFDPTSIVQGSDLLTIQNNANKDLANSNYELRLYKNEGFVFYIDALNHFNELKRDNKKLVGVYYHKQYSGTGTISMYQLVADKDALSDKDAKFFDTLLKDATKESLTPEKQAVRFTTRFVPIMDGNPWTLDPLDKITLISFVGLVAIGGLIFVSFSKDVK